MSGVLLLHHRRLHHSSRSKEAAVVVGTLNAPSSWAPPVPLAPSSFASHMSDPIATAGAHSPPDSPQQPRDKRARIETPTDHVASRAAGAPPSPAGDYPTSTLHHTTYNTPIPECIAAGAWEAGCSCVMWWKFGVCRVGRSFPVPVSRRGDTGADATGPTGVQQCHGHAQPRPVHHGGQLPLR